MPLSLSMRRSLRNVACRFSPDVSMTEQNVTMIEEDLACSIE